MKQIVTFAAFIAFSFAAGSPAMAQATKADQKPQDAVMMKGGKMMMVHDGTATELKTNFTTANGHVIHPNGTVVMNTGTTTTIKEGQTMTLDGKIQEPTTTLQSTPPAGGRLNRR